jgi:hypothetical protein
VDRGRARRVRRRPGAHAIRRRRSSSPPACSRSQPRSLTADLVLARAELAAELLLEFAADLLEFAAGLLLEFAAGLLLEFAAGLLLAAGLLAVTRDPADLGGTRARI